MAMRNYTKDMPPGSWSFGDSEKTTAPRAAQPSSSPRARASQEVFPTLASRNLNPLGEKRTVTRGHVDMSDDPSETSRKRVKLEPAEDTSAFGINGPGNGITIDLTGDSSDDETSKMPATKKITRKPVLRLSPVSEGRSDQMKSPSRWRYGEAIIDTTPKPTQFVQAKDNPNPFSLGDDPMDEDVKELVVQTPGAPSKPNFKAGPFQVEESSDEEDEKVSKPNVAAGAMDSKPGPTGGPFHLDDSSDEEGKKDSKSPLLPKGGPFKLDDSSDEEGGEAENRMRQSTPVPRRSSPISKLTEVPIVNLSAAEKEDARKLSNEMRKATRIRKEAEKAHQDATAAIPPKTAAHRPMPSSGGIHTNSLSGLTPLPQKKRHGASAIVPGRKVEPGRISDANNTASNASRSDAITSRAALTTFGSSKPSSPMETFKRPSSQPMSNLQKSMNDRARRPISPPPKQKKTHDVTCDRPQETAFTSQPSMAANKARSHVEKLREISSSPAGSSKKNNDYGGLSKAQNDELFGEGDDMDIVEEVSAPVAKPKTQQYINLAAQEDSEAHAAKKSQQLKAELAEELRKAEYDAKRAAEQRRKIEAGKAEKQRLAEQRALAEKKQQEEYSRRVAKEGQAREAEELRQAEERKASHAKLNEVNRRVLTDEQKKSKVRDEQFEREKQERIKKQRERKIRREQADLEAKEQDEAEAAIQAEKDLGELVLEGEPTTGPAQRAPWNFPTIGNGEGPSTRDGPVSLNSRAGLDALKNVAPIKVAKPKTVQERIAMESQNWKTPKNKPVAAATPARQLQETDSPFFTSTPTRKDSKAAVNSSTASGPPKKSGGDPRRKKLLPLLPEDAKLLRWKDQEDMQWDEIAVEHNTFSTRGLAPTTLRKRYRQVSNAVKEAKVPFPLMQAFADEDPAAEYQVNAILEAAEHMDQGALRGQANGSALGGGPIRLAPLGQSAALHPLWENPRFDLATGLDVVPVQPRTVWETQARAQVPGPSERQTTGGKCPVALQGYLLREQLRAGDEDLKSDYEDSLAESDSESSDEEDDPLFVDFKAEDYLDYGFQVHRRELSNEDANEAIPLTQQPWIPCGQIFKNLSKANSAARVEVLTIMPNGEFYANPDEEWDLKCVKDKTKPHQQLQKCTLVNENRGTVETKVFRVIQAPRARMVPPTPEVIEEERAGRPGWFVVRTFTIKPALNASYDPLFDSPPEVRTVVEGDKMMYSDRDLANLRAVQDFVDNTFKSFSQSLDTRSEEKRARIEAYLDAILAEKNFEGKMEITRDMQNSTAIWDKYEIEEGKDIQVTFEVCIKDGVLAGPRNL